MKLTAKTVASVALVSLALCLSTTARAGLVNGGFESYNEPAGGVGFFFDAAHGGIPGWLTTDSTNKLEIWGSGYNGGGGPVPAYQGTDFAELNSFEAATLYQDISGITASSLIDFHFAHHGRLGVDTMRLTITDLTFSTILYTNTYSDGNAAWGFYTNPGSIVALGGIVRFAYTAVSSAGGNNAIGNLIDAADFGVGVNDGLLATPEPATFVSAAIAAIVGLGAVVRRRKA